MKKIKVFMVLMSMFASVFVGCKDDSVEPSSMPEFISVPSEITSLPGQTLVFEAVISDPNGIKTVNMNYELWYLDKTIDKSNGDSIYTTYNLSYSFEVPSDEVVGSTHTVSITAVNYDGGTTTQDVLVILDKDIVAPEVQINAPTNGTTVLLDDDTQICLDVSFTDANLTEVQISGDLVDEFITVDETSYNYSNCFDVEEEGTYTFDVTAIDLEGNTTTESVYVNVRGELAFDNLYITEAVSDAGLSQALYGAVFATAASELANEDGFVFSTKYYSSQINTEVRFIPQTTSFSPYSFGASTTESNKLILGDGADVNPIILPAIGYYELTVDLKKMEYTITEVTPSATPYDQIYIIGTEGIIVGETSTCINNTTGEIKCWSYLSSKPLEVDTENPYRWTLEIFAERIEDDEANVGFYLNANPDSWAPFWRYETGDPTTASLGSGNNWLFDAEDRDKAYTIVFDTYLNRISLLTND